MVVNFISTFIYLCTICATSEKFYKVCLAIGLSNNRFSDINDLSKTKLLKYVADAECKL